MTTAELCAAIGPVTVHLDPHDAITAGASMIVVAHGGLIPDERTRQIMLRVGRQLTAAVRAKQLGGGAVVGDCDQEGALMSARHN